MEVYFGKPSLTLLFFQSVTEAKEFTCFHAHDNDLSLRRARVIYLYRDPVDTVFSRMAYDGDDLSDLARIDEWTDLYAGHLHKWLVCETFTEQKAIISYDAMKADLRREFAKVCAFFGHEMDVNLLSHARRVASKETVGDLTRYNRRVINRDPSQRVSREDFREKNANRIRGRMFAQYPELQGWFE